MFNRVRGSEVFPWGDCRGQSGMFWGGGLIPERRSRTYWESSTKWTWGGRGGERRSQEMYSSGAWILAVLLVRAIDFEVKGAN